MFNIDIDRWFLFIFHISLLLLVLGLAVGNVLFFMAAWEDNQFIWAGISAWLEILFVSLFCVGWEGLKDS